MIVFWISTDHGAMLLNAFAMQKWKDTGLCTMLPLGWLMQFRSLNCVPPVPGALSGIDAAPHRLLEAEDLRFD